MLAKRHGFYREEPELMWAIDSANDNIVDQFVKIAPLVMGQKFNEEGKAVYIAAVETVAKYIHNTLHNHKGHYLADKDVTMADFTATAFIYGVVYNDAFPVKEWTEAGQAIFE